MVRLVPMTESEFEAYLEKNILHAFTQNTAAIRLYKGLGYEVTSQSMMKRL